MSFTTTQWACEQQDLKPTTKLVLVQLASFQNARTGKCYPSQKTLCRACGLSLSALNTHLRSLEDRGLIRRQRRTSPRTGACLSTQYSFPTANAAQDLDLVEDA